jgi:hypothetical protein
MNNKKMINAKQAITIHHYKNTKLPEDCNYAKTCRNKLIRKMHNIYRVIHKSRREFRPLRYRSRDGHAEEEHVNRGRDTQSFCPTLQVLVMSTLGDAADVNSLIKFLPHTLQHLAVNSSDFVAAVVNHVT